MTAISDAPVTAHPRRRAALGWIALAVGLLLIGLVGTTLVYGGWKEKGLLDPESPAPDGARALVRILEQQGVTVTVARDRATAERALAGSDATLVMRDAPMLSDATLSSLAERARDVVLVEPRSRALDVLMNGSALGGFAADRAADPGCDLPAPEAAGTARTGELMVPGQGVDGCYRVDGDFGLLSWETSDGRTVTALDGTSTMTNAALPLDGNAALAIGTLARTGTVVWYVPSPSDADAGTAPQTLGDLTPPWVTPAILLLFLSGLVAAIWRGRRFGPLVTERLPVMVRANETTEGRARLYAAAGDAPHALDELRRAARGRLVRVMGLATHTPPEQVADAVAERLGADRGAMRGILITDTPTTDRDLVAASDRLRDLETSVRAALSTERTTR
ncbi:hypothetical protein MTES_0532 [Microbacterium testaceum StLB037]|uniref:DUF4350 domain-containing protein n=1 Tax=Microbacterium testaceum (strain StLB037) TaxID=979556 RepID=E8NBN6_MICTS|nr:DUF4350 domain-containing protein [Microbacterium testaceum]BAJ73496.1 hypothetical protein MTES_0532 [Microbacterium testaceum StLB037]